jgi:hypothetical protein
MGSCFNEPGEIASVAVRLVNTFALGAFSSRVVFNQDVFTVHAVYLTDRVQGLDYLAVDTSGSGVVRVSAFSLIPRTHYLEPGAGDAYVIDFQISESAAAGNYSFRLVDTPYGHENLFTDTTGNLLVVPVLIDGEVEILPSSSVDSDLTLPGSYTLLENYPNPFNSCTVLSLSCPFAGEARIVIYDLLGKEVRELNLGYIYPGKYTTTWNGRDGFDKEVASGVYCYTLFVDQESVQSKKMSLIR